MTRKGKHIYTEADKRYYEKHKKEINEKRKQYTADYWHKNKDRLYALQHLRMKKIYADPKKHEHWKCLLREARERRKDELNKKRRQLRKNNSDWRTKRNKSNSENYWKRKEKTKQELFFILGSVCMFCGETEQTCFDIHHLKKGQSRRLLKISDSLKRWKIYMTQIDEVLLLCSNCHRKLHAGLVVSLIR